MQICECSEDAITTGFISQDWVVVSPLHQLILSIELFNQSLKPAAFTHTRTSVVNRSRSLLQGYIMPQPRSSLILDKQNVHQCRHNRLFRIVHEPLYMSCTLDRKSNIRNLKRYRTNLYIPQCNIAKFSRNYKFI